MENTLYTPLYLSPPSVHLSSSQVIIITPYQTSVSVSLSKMIRAGLFPYFHFPPIMKFIQQNSWIMDYIIFSLRPAGWWYAIFSNVPKGLFERIKRIRNTFKFLKIDTVCMLLMEMEKYRQYPVNSLLQEQVQIS